MTEFGQRRASRQRFGIQDHLEGCEQRLLLPVRVAAMELIRRQQHFGGGADHDRGIGDEHRERRPGSDQPSALGRFEIARLDAFQ
jgi:hypothetical protein